MTATQLAEQQIIKHILAPAEGLEQPASSRWPGIARGLIFGLGALALSTLVLFLVQQFFWLALPLAVLTALALQ